jgi:hypothetical protein
MITRDLLDQLTGDLRNVDAVLRMRKELSKQSQDYDVQLTHQLIKEFDAAIARFNELSRTQDSKLVSIMPRALALHHKLQGLCLPMIAEMSTGVSYCKQFRMGMNHARRMMKNAQDDNPNVGREDKILSIMADTKPESLLLVIVGHLMEQTLFQVFFDIGDKQGWKKDDILMALDDVLMLMVSEGQHAQVAEIFGIIATPTTAGGIGWIKSERLQMFREAYSGLRV